MSIDRRLPAVLILAMFIMVPYSSMISSVLGEADGPAISPMGYGGREKDLTFLLHSINASESSKVIAGHTTDLYMDTTLDFNETSVTYEVTTSATYTWYLDPVLAGDLNVSHFAFKMWIWATSTLGTPQGNLSVDIYEVTSSTWTFVAHNHTGNSNFLSTADLRVVSGDLSHTFSAGSTIVVNMTLALNAGDSMHFAFDTPKANSRFLLRTHDGASLSEICTMDYNGLMNSSFDPAEANKTIYITANISDELGGYDIKWVNVTLEHGGQTILDNVTMTRTVGSNTSLISLYQREWNYTGYSNGRYNYTIWITDNSGHNNYYHLGMYLWDNYTSEETSYFTLGKMVFVNVQVVDSGNATLEGARLIFKPDGSASIAGSALTNETGMHNFTTIFTGIYDAIVIWQGVEVANVSVTIKDNVTEDDPLIITAGVYYPVFSIVDGKGNDLEDASVYMRFPNQTITAQPYRTDENGEFNLTRAAGGTYGLDITWMDVIVNSTSVTVDSNNTLIIYTSVFYLTTIVVDSRNVPLAGAQVILANSTSGIVFDSKITNLTGGYEFRLPSGDYDISVYWQNSIIYHEANHTHDCNDVLTLVGDIYYLVVRVVDTHDIPVDSAQVVVAASEGNVLDSNFTDEQGRIDSRLPRGTHVVSVYWLGVLTNRSPVTFNDDSEVTLVASIYYPKFTFLDADGGPLENARIDFMINETGETIESVVSDPNGTIFVRLPATQYDINVYWKGVLVHSELDFAIAEDLDIVRNVAVYNLEIVCVDSRDAPLRDARVSMMLSLDGRELASASTDDNGTMTLRLPGATYDIEVWWQNSLVAEELDFVLDASGQHVISTSVFYLDGTAIDSRDHGIPGAIVHVTDVHGILLTTLMTDGDGQFTARLPIGEYDITISWKEIIVNQTIGLDLQSDLAIDFSCDVYYLKLTPVDSRARFIKDALVTVTSSTNGKVVATGIAGITGIKGLEFRLPADVYHISVVWHGVLVNTTTDLALDSDRMMDLDCAVYYLTVILLDTQGKIVQDAHVDVALVDGNLTTHAVTDGAGEITFRLPVGSYDLDVAWRGVQVYDEDALWLSSDDIWTFEATIYYPEFVLKDSRRAAVGGAHLEVYLKDEGSLMGSSDVSDEGRLTLRLPMTEYTVLATWLGHEVLDTDVLISANAEVELVTKVFYFEPEITDTRDVAVEEAIVDLGETGTGALLGTSITDTDGKASIRLPIGTYDILVSWRGVIVYTEQAYQLDSDSSYPIQVNIFYLTMSLIDDRQVPVEDAFTEVLYEEAVFGSSLSPADGKVIFRLPLGTYFASTTWAGVLVGTEADIHLSQDLAITKSLDIFYLTVQVKDSEGEKLKGAMVSVLKDGTDPFGAENTKGNGMAEFRLPVGEYTVKVSYSVTYLMSEYSSTLKKDISLTDSTEEKFVFSDYPPPIYTTNTFLVSVLSILLIVLILVAGLKLGLIMGKSKDK